MIVPGPEGVYVVGTGNTGAAMTFLTLGIGYFVVMIIASFIYRVPRAGWQPAGWTPPSEEESGRRMITSGNVHIDQALKTPQFYLLWIMLCFNVTAGIGVIGVAKTMMTEIFGTTLPGLVDGAFAATYVLMISVFNMVGRFFWASTSDFIGRKNTYHCFFVLGTILYLSIPFTAQAVSASPAVIWLVVFYAATMIIFTMYGGGFATIPAYLADVFGTMFVGGIHGRLLTAWSTAGVLGPFAITYLRQMSIGNAIDDLAAKVDPQAFQQKFGAGLDQLDQLVAANTVTVGRLMEIAPAGKPRVTFVCVHFDWLDDDTERFAQAEALLAALDDAGGVIVAGDFNDTPGSRTIRAFEEAGFRIVAPGEGEGATFPSAGPTKRIDFVMHRPSFGFVGTAEVLAEEVASDHRPVLAELEWVQ